MILLDTIRTVDITKEIPFRYWLLFIGIMAVVLPLASRFLTSLFIPQKGEEEAKVWSVMEGKNKKNKKNKKF